MTFPLDETQYELLHLIGTSTNTKVYEARCIANNQMVAIKQINLQEYPLDLKTIQDQTSPWLNCSHPNIVKFHGLFVVENIVWMIMELLSHGSIKQILKFAYSHGFHDEVLIATILSQVVNGLKYLHDNKLYHHDLRSSKILINSDGVVKLTEIGLSTSIATSYSKRSKTLSLFGEECYSAPEVLKNDNDYTQKSDIWSLGLFAIELGTGKMPYAGMKFMESLAKIINSDPPCLPETGNFSLQYREFVKLCMIKQVSKRASSKDLLNSKFIKFVAKGPEIVQRIIMSSLPSVADMYKQINLSEKNLPNDIQIVKDGNIQNAPPPNSNPVQTVGRFKVTRTESLPKNQSHMPINIQFQDQIPKEQNLPPHDQNDSNSHQKEIEDLATELLQLSEEMQQLQKENSCLKRKMEDITAVISNIQDKKKNSQ